MSSRKGKTNKCNKQVEVKPYKRRNGTKVDGHKRRCPKPKKS